MVRRMRGRARRSTVVFVEAVLATGPDNTRWLLNQGRRYRLGDDAARRVGQQRATPLSLPAEILDLLPEGAPIAAPRIAGPGAAATGVPRTWVVADVVRVQAGGAVCESLAVLPDGVVPVSELTAALLVAAGSNEVAADPATAASARRSRTAALGDPGWPEVVPQPVGPQRDQPLCLSTTPGDPAGDAPWLVRMSLPGVVLAPGEQPVHTGQGDTPGVVDQVVVPRGSGALVLATTATPPGGSSAWRIPCSAASTCSATRTGGCSGSPVRVGTRGGPTPTGGSAATTHRHSRTRRPG